jgi:DNA invertase Pin-like site-specific DNA recombinase
VTELSRLGRDTLQVLQTIEILNQNKISLYIQNYNIETLTPEKEINPMSQFLVTILAEVARMERKTIEIRLFSGYQNFRNSGGIVGRKSGFRKSNEVMKDEYVEEIKMLKKGYSFTHINQITTTNKNTLTKLKKLFVD